MSKKAPNSSEENASQYQGTNSNNNIEKYYEKTSTKFTLITIIWYIIYFIFILIPLVHSSGIRYINFDSDLRVDNTVCLILFLFSPGIFYFILELITYHFARIEQMLKTGGLLIIATSLFLIAVVNILDPIQDILLFLIASWIYSTLIVFAVGSIQFGAKVIMPMFVGFELKLNIQEKIRYYNIPPRLKQSIFMDIINYIYKSYLNFNHFNERDDWCKDKEYNLFITGYQNFRIFLLLSKNQIFSLIWKENGRLLYEDEDCKNLTEIEDYILSEQYNFKKRDFDFEIAKGVDLIDQAFKEYMHAPLKRYTKKVLVTIALIILAVAFLLSARYIWENIINNQSLTTPLTNTVAILAIFSIIYACILYVNKIIKGKSLKKKKEP